jgi:hypothetical protein
MDRFAAAVVIVLPATGRGPRARGLRHKRDSAYLKAPEVQPLKERFVRKVGYSECTWARPSIAAITGTRMLTTFSRTREVHYLDRYKSSPFQSSPGPQPKGTKEFSILSLLLYAIYDYRHEPWGAFASRSAALMGLALHGNGVGHHCSKLLRFEAEMIILCLR